MVFRVNTLLNDLILKSKEDLIREMSSPKKTSDQIFNVKSYGAKGDGKADDWNSLQKAIDAVYSRKGGGNLFFPPGLYRISAPLEVPVMDEGNPVSWLGQSPDSTTIAPSEPMDYLVRMRGSGGSVKGIEFRGTDPMNGSAQYAKVCMLATDIKDKIFSNAAFNWGSVHGLQITREGNNNLCVFDRLCQFSQNGKVVKGRDARGSGNQIIFSTFNPKKNDVHVGAYFKMGRGKGSVYHIDAVASNSITVSPELKSPIRLGSEYAIHVGCGLQTDRGSDNNVYGIYDCHFIGNAGAGLMARGLYGHHIQGGNFDSNGITGMHIGSGSINTTPAYSGSIIHSYFENNGYSNVILDYPSGLSIIEPLLPDPVDGTKGGIDSITSLREHDFDYSTTSIIYNGRLHQFVAETSEAFFDMDDAPRVAVKRPSRASGPTVIKLPDAPEHLFDEELEIYIEESGGQQVRLISDYVKVNNKSGKAGVSVPAGEGYKITAYYSREKASWMVSYTTPLG